MSIRFAGKVGITLNTDWQVPKNPNDPADLEAAERAEQFRLGWFANPIFGNGDYPGVMRSQIDSRSKAENLSESRLPKFTEEEKQVIKGLFNSMVSCNDPLPLTMICSLYVLPLACILHL